MARPDNDPGCCLEVRKVVVRFCFGKGPLDHAIGEPMYVDGGAFSMTKPRAHRVTAI